MLICGVKASHDGGVALIEDGRLIASIELEKIDNGRRYSPLGRLTRVGDIIRDLGVDPGAIDQIVVDGWWKAPGAASPTVEIVGDEGPTLLPVAPYIEGVTVRDPLHCYEFGPARFFGGLDPVPYIGYHHTANHILGSYCTSPFAARGEDSLVVVWDGGMAPSAYHVSATGREITPLGQLLPIIGNTFPDFCSHLDPFHRDTSGMSSDEYMAYHLEIAGKAMAYAALGNVSTRSTEAFDKLFSDLPDVSTDNAFLMGEKMLDDRTALFGDATDADIIATLQTYLGSQLLRSVERLVKRRYAGKKPNLCLGGGCALNIKWNHSLRESGMFREVWIPPFPNDSGAAIGTAACEMFRSSSSVSLDWNVYSGPSLGPAVADEWPARPCDAKQLAALLHESGEPVVVLTGRAELGPRALGNRSIIAPATEPRMKDRLNEIKGRAGYRPVAPICLESRAPEVFEPGTPDPYMLFEHGVRADWLDRVPAIVHLDGSARLQTINAASGSVIYDVLAEYARLSGIPVLCNTSANLSGSGFFPDIRTAAEWGRVRYLWSGDTLYTRPDRD